MDIDLDALGLRTVGRPKEPLHFSLSHELEAEDLARLALPRKSAPAPIKKLRERHHALARQLASGVSHSEAALICGYSLSRISILQADPSFIELIALYRQGAQERYFDAKQAMAELHLDATAEIADRLADAPEDFSVGQLLEVMKATADRTGLGPSTTSNVDIRVGLADRLAAGRKRLNELRNITPTEIEGE